MFARSLKAIVSFVLLLLMAGGLAFAFHVPLLESALTWALKERGIEAQLKLATIGFQEAHIKEARLGPGNWLQASEITLSYQLEELLKGQIAAVDIAYLEADLDLTTQEQPWAKIVSDTDEDSSDGGEESQDIFRYLPPLSLKASKIRLTDSFGEVSIDFSGNLWPEDNEALAVAGDFHIRSPQLGEATGNLTGAKESDGRLIGDLMISDGNLDLPEAELSGLNGNISFQVQNLVPIAIDAELSATKLLLDQAPEGARDLEELSLSASLTDKSLTIIGSFLSSDGLVSGSGTLALSDYVEGGSLDGNLDFSLQSPSPLPTVFGFPAVDSGKLTIGLDLSGSAPSLAELAALEWNSAEFLNQLDLTVKGKAEADGLSLASLVSNASLKARFKVVPNADGPAIDGRFKLSGEQFQLGDYSLKDVTVRGTASGDFEALKFDITSETQLEGPLGNIGWIGDAAISLGLFVNVTRDGADIELRNPSSIVVEDLDLPAGPALVTPQSFSLEELNVKADFTNEPHYVFDGLLETVSLDTEINAGGMQQFLSARSLDARFAGSFSGSELLMMEGTIRSASVRLAQEDYQIEDLEVTYKLRNDGNDIEASYSLLAADKGPEPPLFNPFPVAGRLNLKNGNIEADGTADWGLADPQLKFTAHYNPDLSKIQAEITLSPSEFSETHQPSIYSALAEPFTEVTGTAEAKTHLVWKNGDLTSDGELVLKDIGFKLAGVTFEDLDTTLTFTSLMPLVSEPNQRIALTRSDPGVPARNIEAVFEFLPAEGPLPAIRLDSARLEFLRSSIKFLPKTYDLNKEKFDIEARIENLDLANLFELIDLDDIKGEGIISGVLPLSVRKDGVEIRGGRLQAVGPGHLSIRSPQARAILAPYGDQAALLVEALEDFYYSELEITVDKTFDEDLSAGISLLGSNPNVLEGHPFRLNINLESNIERVAIALFAGYSAAQRALRKAWKATKDAR